MQLKVNDITVIGTVEECIDFLKRYDELPGRTTMDRLTWNKEGNQSPVGSSNISHGRLEDTGAGIRVKE